MYSPMIPRLMSCTPLTKQTMQVMLAQPATALPQSAVIRAQMQPMKLMSATITPKLVIRRSGLTERLVIPSIARPSIFFSG